MQQELGDDRGDAVEMIGPRGAAQILGQVADADMGAEALRIHLGRVGREDEIGAGLGELGEIALFVARVVTEVLARAELDRVHEDGHDHVVGFALGEGDEGEMAFMQRAHGGHESDRLARLSPSGDVAAQVADRPHCGEGARHVSFPRGPGP